MGNSRWRLETTVNYIAQNICELNREQDIEIFIVDWGSKVPLYKVLKLTSEACKLTSFLFIPPDVAKDVQKDSPYSEVHALNAAARHVNGQYIGRIDADTLVGKRFLTAFFEFYFGDRHFNTPLESTLIWANRRGIPYRFTSRSPLFWQVDKFMHLFSRKLKIDTPDILRFFDAPVGIWLLHIDRWKECGGYNEQFIYWGNMESDMIHRLSKKYSLVHLEEYVDCDFYHLEHYNPLKPRVTSRKMNPEKYDDKFHANDKNWGLERHSLKVIPGSSINSLTITKSKTKLFISWFFFIIMLSSVGIQIIWDNKIFIRRFIGSFFRFLKSRARRAMKVVYGHHVSS